MKKTVLVLRRFIPALFLSATLVGVTFAQKSTAPSPKSGDRELSVRIIDRNGDDVQEIERTYNADGLSAEQRDKLVTKLVDSVRATRKDGSKRQLTIIVDDNTDGKLTRRNRLTPGMKRIPNDAYVQRNRSPRLNFDWQDSQNKENWQNWQYELRKGTDTMADQLRRFKFEFPKDFDRQLVRPFEGWARNFGGKPSTIRNLDAFPNNPDRNQINVRFTAPSKGDVSIAITNPKGKEVARREIKDFSGEFVGQIDLGKKADGIYFITVTQNEDGAVKRIVLDDTDGQDTRK